MTNFPNVPTYSFWLHAELYVWHICTKITLLINYNILHQLYKQHGWTRKANLISYLVEICKNPWQNITFSWCVYITFPGISTVGAVHEFVERHAKRSIEYCFSLIIFGRFIWYKDSVCRKSLLWVVTIIFIKHVCRLPLLNDISEMVN